MFFHTTTLLLPADTNHTSNKLCLDIISYVLHQPIPSYSPEANVNSMLSFSLFPTAH